MDFSDQISADKKAGYPPNCNEGYAEKDGKCVPVEKADAAPGWSGPNVYKPGKKAGKWQHQRKEKKAKKGQVQSWSEKKKSYTELWKKVKSK